MRVRGTRPSRAKRVCRYVGGGGSGSGAVRNGLLRRTTTNRASNAVRAIRGVGGIWCSGTVRV